MELLLGVLMLLLTRCVSAVVTFLQPEAGQEVTGGTSFTVRWILDPGTIDAANLSTYTLALCAGGNNESNYAVLSTLVQSAAFANDTQLSENMETTAGGSDVNAYFFMLVTNYTGGGAITSFSSRFTLSYMVGTFAPGILAGIQTASSSTHGPSEIVNITKSYSAKPSATSSISDLAPSTTASTTSSSLPSDISAGLRTSGKIGLGIGVPLGILGLALGAYLLFQYRKRRSESRPWHPMGSELDVTAARAELDATTPEAELHTPANSWELPTNKEFAVELPG